MVEASKLEKPTKPGVFMLFLPEGELHEIGLLFANYLIRAKGYKTIYLGQSVPISDVEKVFHTINPEYLFTIITSSPNNSKLEKLIGILDKRFKDAKVLLAGNQILSQSVLLPKSIHVVNHFSELDKVLEKTEAAS